MILKTFKDFGYEENPERRLLPWIHMSIQANKLDKVVTFGYDKLIHIYEVNEMRKKFYFEIPYGRRSSWIERCWKLNQMVGTKGIFELFVCDIPYNLRSCIFFDYSGDVDDILTFCKENKIDLSYEKGSEELYEDMRKRMWNSIAFASNTSLDEFRDSFRSLFHFCEIDELNKRGYFWDEEKKRKKIFISYAWKDQKAVYDVVKQLQQSGVSVFIDTQSIDYGEHILEKILSGLDEADMSIFFISQGFSKSKMAKNEMRSVWMKVIEGKKAWIIIKLDDIEPDSIFFSLSDYKYFNYQKDSIENLIMSIHKKLEQTR